MITFQEPFLRRMAPAPTYLPSGTHLQERNLVITESLHANIEHIWTYFVLLQTDQSLATWHLGWIISLSHEMSCLPLVIFSMLLFSCFSCTLQGKLFVEVTAAGDRRPTSAHKHLRNSALSLIGTTPNVGCIYALPLNISTICLSRWWNKIWLHELHC